MHENNYYDPSKFRVIMPKVLITVPIAHLQSAAAPPLIVEHPPEENDPFRQFLQAIPGIEDAQVEANVGPGGERVKLRIRCKRIGSPFFNLLDETNSRVEFIGDAFMPILASTIEAALVAIRADEPVKNFRGEIVEASPAESE